jgi:hypothetical protein
MNIRIPQMLETSPVTGQLAASPEVSLLRQVASHKYNIYLYVLYKIKYVILYINSVCPSKGNMSNFLLSLKFMTEPHVRKHLVYLLADSNESCLEFYDIKVDDELIHVWQFSFSEFYSTE